MSFYKYSHLNERMTLQDNLWLIQNHENTKYIWQKKSDCQRFNQRIKQNEQLVQWFDL